MIKTFDILFKNEIPEFRINAAFEGSFNSGVYLSVGDVLGDPAGVGVGAGVGAGAAAG